MTWPVVVVLVFGALMVFATLGWAWAQADNKRLAEHLRLEKILRRKNEDEKQAIRDIVYDCRELMQPLMPHVSTERIVDKAFVEVYARLYRAFDHEDSTTPNP